MTVWRRLWADLVVAAMMPLVLYSIRPRWGYIAPFPCNGDTKRTWSRLVELVRALPGAEIETQTSSYLYAQCSSKLLGFVDDLECLLDRKRDVIHVRSAARLGRRDFGVNAARVEKLRAQLGDK